MAVLALGSACGSDDEATTPPSDDDGTVPTAPDNGAALAVAFPPNGFLHTGVEQRMPFILFVGGAPAKPADAPEQLPFWIVREPSEATGEPHVVVDRAGEGVPRPYYPVVTDFEETGNWFVVTEVDGAKLEAAVAVSEPSEISMIKVGDTMPEVATPTIDDAHGVEQICTRQPACELHDVTLTDALDENGPTALLISSPAFCQTAVCGPVLDNLLAVTGDFPDVHFLHAEVFAQPEADPPVPAPILDATGLGHEPVLYVIGADRVVTARLDSVMDLAEVRGALQSVST